MFALLLLAVSPCRSAHNRTGANADLRHCHDARDARNLLVVPELPRASSIFFEIGDALHDEFTFDSPLGHSFDLPYLAFDARYILSFRTAGADVTTTECSSDFVNKDERPSLEIVEPSDWSEAEEPQEQTRWDHAPNAAYPSALGNPLFGAYYTSPKSCWRVSQSAHFPCSSVVYASLTSLADLEKCGALSVLSLANDTVRIASYTIEINLETPTIRPYGSNHITVGIYADKHDNTARVTLVNGRTFDSPLTILSVIVQTLSVSAGGLDFVLVVRARAPLTRDMLSVHTQNISDIELRDFSQLSSEIHYLGFSTNKTLAIYKERITIDVRPHKHTHHADVASVLVDLHVANPEAIQVESDGLISNHISMYSERGVVGRDEQVVDNSRVCVVNSVNVPVELQPAISVKLVEAWLCVLPAKLVDLDDAETYDRLKCSQQRHKIELLRDGKLSANATVVFPGRLGATSIELCFNTTLQIVDSDKLTLEAPNQRYESQIKLVPRAQTALFSALRNEHVLATQFDRDLLDATHNLSTYAEIHVQRSISRLSAEHTRAISFAVSPALGTSHGVSRTTSTFVLVLVFLMFFCVIGVYVVLSSVDVASVFRRPSFAEHFRNKNSNF